MRSRSRANCSSRSASCQRRRSACTSSRRPTASSSTSRSRSWVCCPRTSAVIFRSWALALRRPSMAARKCRPLTARRQRSPVARPRSRAHSTRSRGTTPSSPSLDPRPLKPSLPRRHPWSLGTSGASGEAFATATALWYLLLPMPVRRGVGTKREKSYISSNVQQLPAAGDSSSRR